MVSDEKTIRSYHEEVLVTRVPWFCTVQDRAIVCPVLAVLGAVKLVIIKLGAVISIA